jgi:two-component system OmpR family response regulator
MTKRILIVDDDVELRELLRGYLGGNGFDVAVAGDAAALRRQLAAGAMPDLLILDLMLPGEDGLALCRALRADPATAALPILMLTARGEDTDRIIGLEMGADDYLPKPFNPRELLARIRSILRRAGDATRLVPVRALAFAGWTLDLGARHLVDADGLVVPLSNGEFKLLRAFAENPYRVLSRDQLMDALAGREAGPFDRSVDVMVHRVRRRLRDDAREPQLVKTIRSEGYMLAAEVEKRP